MDFIGFVLLDLNEPKAFSVVTEDVFATKLECEKFRESKSIEGREESRASKSAVGSAISTGNSATIQPKGGEERSRESRRYRA